MILIADSGSTKCDWAQCSVSGDILQIHKTVGFNPKYTTRQNMISELERSTLLMISDQVKEIHFYGAGCSSEKKNKVIKSIMQEFFQNAKITVKHDLQAAAEVAYSGCPVICSILGTGSNSCIYDGENILENAPSLGYILGDEASGSYFGKQLINLYVNQKLPSHLVKKLEKWTKDRPKDMIKKIYSLEKPNLYLANFFRFMIENKTEIIFNKIFKKGIENFFSLHIKCFKNYDRYPLVFVGSVAFYLSDYINEIAKKELMCVQVIIKSPIEDLVIKHFY